MKTHTGDATHVCGKGWEWRGFVHPCPPVRDDNETPRHLFLFLQALVSLLLFKCFNDLKYGPCPPTRDWGSRVSGLVLLRFSPLHLLLFLTLVSTVKFRASKTHQHVRAFHDIPRLKVVLISVPHSNRPHSRRLVRFYPSVCHSVGRLFGQSVGHNIKTC